MNITTNLSSFRAITVVAFMAALFAAPSYAFAQEYYDGGCCDTAYYDTGYGYDDTAYYDTGYGSDTGTSYYDTGYGYDTGTSYYDTGYGYDTGTSYYDTGYGSDTGTSYYDTGYGYNTGSDTSYYDTGYGYDTGSSQAYDAYDYYQTTDTSYTTSQPSYNYGGGTSSYSIPTPTYTSGYTGGYTGGYKGGYTYSQTPRVTTPTYKTPTYKVPSYSSGSTTNNTCVNNSCNTNISKIVTNNIDNSINNSGNTNITNSGNTTVTTTNSGNTTIAKVTPVTPQYTVQYTIPQYTYPVIQTPTYYPTQNLYCTITSSSSSVQNGQTTYLSWSSTGAYSATLSDGIGSVAVTGSLAVRPNSTKTYVLTVYGQGTSRTCSVQVGVYSSGSSYVALSQIPYTGFDYGPMGNAIYWMGLVAFALSAAYLVLYYQGGMLSFATATTKREVEPIILSEEVVEEEAPQTEEPAVASLANLPVAEDKRTSDSMTVDTSNGMPRIVISRA